MARLAFKLPTECYLDEFLGRYRFFGMQRFQCKQYIPYNAQHKYSSVALYSTKPSKAPDQDTHPSNMKEGDSIADRLTRALKNHPKSNKLQARIRFKSDENRSINLLKPVVGYKPRFSYNGYLKNCNWISYDQNPKPIVSAEYIEKQQTYNKRKKSKYCLLLAFVGNKYHGMQYNEPFNTIERQLFEAMLKNDWILSEHLNGMWGVRFVHGSRTDKGVSALRMTCSMVLPNDVCVDGLNKELPDDIRLVALIPTTRQFDARTYCSARTYSYTLPTISFNNYDDLSQMEHFRIAPSQFQRAKDIFSVYKGHTNFHNFAPQRLYYDRSSTRRIDSIRFSEPFVERDVEFCRIVIKGESFMLHQIRRMIGFALAVIRGIVGEDMIERSLTKENVNVPTAPGIGLVLEQLHYPEYKRKYPHLNPLTFDEYNHVIEQFRREKIHLHIVETEIRERTMCEWVDGLGAHSFSAESKARENLKRYHYGDEVCEEFGENPEFLEKLRKYREENC